MVWGCFHSSEFSDDALCIIASQLHQFATLSPAITRRGVFSKLKSCLSYTPCSPWHTPLWDPPGTPKPHRGVTSLTGFSLFFHCCAVSHQHYPRWIDWRQSAPCICSNTAGFYWPDAANVLLWIMHAPRSCNLFSHKGEQRKIVRSYSRRHQFGPWLHLPFRCPKKSVSIHKWQPLLLASLLDTTPMTLFHREPFRLIRPKLATRQLPQRMLLGAKDENGNGKVSSWVQGKRLG